VATTQHTPKTEENGTTSMTVQCVLTVRMASAGLVPTCCSTNAKIDPDYVNISVSVNKQY
jgi:hypothetical protein